MRRREHELRCFCRSKPLLATYGIDSFGVLFVHVKVYKGDRIYGEIVVEGGLVKLHCRNCLRWHRVNISGTRARLAESETPEADQLAV